VGFFVNGVCVCVCVQVDGSFFHTNIVSMEIFAFNFIKVSTAKNIAKAQNMIRSESNGNKLQNLNTSTDYIKHVLEAEEG